MTLSFFKPLVRHCLTAAVVFGITVGVAAHAENVRLTTSAGDIVIKLDEVKAPMTVANFVSYVKAGQYDGTIFHRVIPNFMIQGGGFTPELREKPTRPPIKLESRTGLSNVRGSVSMARTSDPDSAAAQFFINVADNSRLDAANSPDGNGYAVFGRVVSGMDVIDKIRKVPTGSKGSYDDVPNTPVVIKHATLEK